MKPTQGHLLYTRKDTDFDLTGSLSVNSPVYLLARLSYYNLRPNLRPTTLFSRSGKIILAKLYLLKCLGCILGRRLGHRL